MRDRLGAGAATVCDVPARLAHRSRRVKELPQRQGRHLRLHRPDELLSRLPHGGVCRAVRPARGDARALQPRLRRHGAAPRAARAPHDMLKRLSLRLYDLRRPGRVVSGVPRIPRRGGVSAQYALTVDRWSDWLVLPLAWVLSPRGKSTQQRAKTKVLASFSVDKWGFSRTWPKCSIGFRSAQRRYYI